MSRYANRPRLSVVLVAVLAALAITESVVLAATLSRTGGPLRAVKIVTSDTTAQRTYSTTWADVPGMSTSMAVPGGEHGLFLITFSASSACAEAEELACIGQIRVLVNGVEASPGALEFAGSSPSTVGSANSMQFVSGPFSAATHTIKVQFRQTYYGTLYIKKATLSVIRSKV